MKHSAGLHSQRRCVLVTQWVPMRPVHLRAGLCCIELEASGGYFVTCVSLGFRSRLYLAELHPRAAGGEVAAVLYAATILECS